MPSDGLVRAAYPAIHIGCDGVMTTEASPALSGRSDRCALAGSKTGQSREVSASRKKYRAIFMRINIAKKRQGGKFEAFDIYFPLIYPAKQGQYRIDALDPKPHC